MASERPARATDATHAEVPARRIGTHYELVAELGRGGMAVVWHVVDKRSGKHVALKQLLEGRSEQETRTRLSLFEREFHTLAQLAHPRVIEVYDYGVEQGAAYYTMELLDGGDLSEHSPMPYRKACELIFDVCSSLALLHSRRLVHRDVSPRNVRCTQSGHAKLIDFGAMIPFGSDAPLVGTPAFVAPEVMYETTLDARADLFSLGVTLYFALTRKLPYPARTFADLAHCWTTKPVVPSALVADVPVALDHLVMSLISLDPALRPRSAFEVMQRLASIAGITRHEPLTVSKAYLVTPTLTARDEALAVFHEMLHSAQQGSGGVLLFMAGEGLGRTRMLDACAIAAKTTGFQVLRSTRSGATGVELGTIRALMEQLLQSAPALAVEAARVAAVHDSLFEPNAQQSDALRLRTFARAGRDGHELARALVDFFVAASELAPLLITADDMDRFDDSSIALFATLAERAKGRSLLVVGAASDAPQRSTALSVLSSRARAMPLRKLDLSETELLLESVFGDVPNLALLSSHVHARSDGRPREIMNLAQHLIDVHAIEYVGGSWSLPEQLPLAHLPVNTAAIIRARAASLSALARALAEAQALSLEDHFLREDYALLRPDADAAALDAALSELLAEQLLTSHEGRRFSLEHAAMSVLCDALSDNERQQRYRELAERSERIGAHVVQTGRLRLLAGDSERGLDQLFEGLRPLKDLTGAAAISLGPVELGHTLASAFRKAVELDRPERDLHDLRHWLTLLSVSCEEDLYWPFAPTWRQRLEHDSGLDDYRALTDAANPQDRLMRAIASAGARYAAAAERERVYPPQEAIRWLVQYVAISIAEGSRGFNMSLLVSLPSLLEPFAPLSPLIDAIWQNAIAAVESTLERRTERANQRWSDVYERLAHVQGPDGDIVSAIRYAVAYGVGINQAATGMASALRWAELLDADPMNRVNAMYLRRVMSLQRGDLKDAERWRKQAELLALQTNRRQMFNTLVSLDLVVHATVWDLTGVKHAAERIRPLAERYEGWAAFGELAEAFYRRLLGDLSAAEQAFARALELSAPDPNDPLRCIIAWPVAVVGLAETLIALGRVEEAYTLAADAEREAERREIGVNGNDIVRILGVAEAKLGDCSRAAARVDALIERQLALGITGLNLGTSYEARTRIAICAGDTKAVEHFAALTARHFRYGYGSTLGARYERLAEEANATGVHIVQLQSEVLGRTLSTWRPQSRVTAVQSELEAAASRDERAMRALAALCQSLDVRKGHLFLPADGGLQLTASTGSISADTPLQRYAQEFWAHHMGDDELETQYAPSLSLCKDSEGVVYRPLLLRGGGELLPAGVLLVEASSEQSLTAEQVELFSAVASALLRHAD